VIKNVKGRQEGGGQQEDCVLTALLRKVVEEIGRDSTGIADKWLKMHGVTAILPL
jgi:hypothetical protein